MLLLVAFVTSQLAFLILALIISPTTALTPIVGVGSFVSCIVESMTRFFSPRFLLPVIVRQNSFCFVSPDFHRGHHRLQAIHSHGYRGGFLASCNVQDPK